jgi:hypothetical protein
MGKISLAIMAICILFVNGCANRLNTMISPQFATKITPVSQIGISGGGASPGSAAFVQAGYSVKDLGNDSTSAIAVAKTQNIPFVAIIDQVGTDGSWWDGFFDFSMRVNETASGTIVWSATAEYGQAGMFINQTKSTKEAMRDMVKDFSKHFPPKSSAETIRDSNSN